MLAKSIQKNSLILGAFALLTAGVLASTFLVTKERIVEEERKAAKKALLEIVPASRIDNDILTDTSPITADLIQRLHLDPEGENAIHIARKDGRAIAVIIPSVAPDGYSGKIKFIVGINVDGRIAGVRVLSHKETPGLGDKIDLNKDDWILNFDGKSLIDPELNKWKVKKDGGQFDQFTGATITPRAMVNQIKNTLVLFQENKASILTSDNKEAKAHDELP